MANTIEHPITGKVIEIAGVVGNIYPSKGNTFTSDYMIRVHGANSYVDLSAAGKFIFAAEGEMQGEIFETGDEAEAERAAWLESYPDASTEIIEIEESWGTASC